MRKLIDVDKLRESLEFNLTVYQNLADKQIPVNAEFVAADLKRFSKMIDYAPDLSVKEDADLEKEIDRWFGEKYMQNMVGLPIKPTVQIIARHFYELGLNAKREE